MNKFAMPLLIVAALSCAHDTATAEAPTSQALAAARQATGAVNGLCPVMRRVVTTGGGRATYKGEIIAFCCPGCASQFKADPVRYMERLRSNPAKYGYVSRYPALALMRKAKANVGVVNGRCPVMGKVVVARGGTVIHKRQTIGFCCPPCIAKFQADPDKYMRLMRADPSAYAYDRPGPSHTELRVAREAAGGVNGRCPVMGKLVTPRGGSLMHDGQKITFCCPPCIAKFKADPDRYMALFRAEPWMYGYAGK